VGNEVDRGKNTVKHLLPRKLVKSGFEHAIKEILNGRNLMTLLLWGSENKYYMRQHFKLQNIKWQFDHADQHEAKDC
jgi:hypothetical protein